ncbi:MAG: hypothetical protein ACXW2U_09350 [Telluria sp.]
MCTDNSSDESQQHQCEQSEEPECRQDSASDDEGCRDECECDEREYSLGATQFLLAAHTFRAGKTLVDVETQREIPAWLGKLIFGAVFAVIVAIGVAIAVNSN